MSITRFRHCLVAVVSLILSACVSNSSSHGAKVPSQYCDSYFAYDMCARDHNGDGAVDFMYFQDTGEVFMAMPDFQIEDVTGRPFHQCIQVMDGAMQSAASGLLSIRDDTSNLAKTQIKSRLLFSYSRYMSRVNRCHGTNLAADEGAFGEGVFGETDPDF